MPTKLIVTNKKALRSKYGTRGWRKIEQALDNMVASEKQRGVLTRWVAMDLKSGVRDFGAPAIDDPADPEQTKTTIDALWQKAKPDYLMILGAPDVVCHQSLFNPMTGKDEDEDVPSDLPYACGVPFSEETANFTGPTRVVGRLPDLNGATDPEALLKSLATAADWQSRNSASYRSYFALTALAWKKSTQMTAKKAFGSSKVQYVSPTAGQPWSKKELSPRLQLINCHGADSDTWFYGDDTNSADFPTIRSSDYLNRIREGTVLAAECCYGAQLFDPSFMSLFDPAAAVEPPICNQVLAQGAYGMLGSTNIAYGPADANDKADLLCLYFLRNVRRGASLGRALLEARQEYVSNTAPSDPFDLKTLAQFNLLGDPAVHPVKMSSSTQKSMAKSRRAVAGRRKAMRTRGRQLRVSLAKVVSKADKKLDQKIVSSIYDRIRKLLVEQNLIAGTTAKSFTVKSAATPLLAKSKTAMAKAQGGERFHIFEASKASATGVSAATLSKNKKNKKRGPDAVVVAKERSGKIESIQTLFRR